MKTAIVFLADGFEECEGLLAVDLLRRAGVEVITASVMGRREILSSHRISLLADVLAEEADYDAADLLILPGGMPGTDHLRESELVRAQCLAFGADKRLAAICAAPSVLAELGLLEGKPAACHPSVASRMGGAVLTGEAVAEAGNIITGQGLGAAIPFALRLIRVLTDGETAERVAAQICWRG